MGVAGLIAELCRQGVTFTVDDDRLGVQGSQDALTPEICAELILVKPELVKLVPLMNEYRGLLRDAFNALLIEDDFTRESRDALLPEDQEDFLDDQARLIDELGPPLASAVYLLTGREWRRQASRCPWCDEDGTCHEPTPRVDHT